MSPVFTRCGLRLAALGLAVVSLGPAPAQTACAMPPRPEGLAAALVTRIVDGDTVQIAQHRLPAPAWEDRQARGGRGRLRLLGVDTPEVFESDRLDRDARESGRTREEVQALGRLSSEYTRRHLDGKDVYIEFDVQERDRFGRLLAYVWLADQEGGTLFNLTIVRDGYAQVLTVPPNVKYADLLLACQREARRHNRGLWGR
jgi:micrococcal nuclease